MKYLAIEKYALIKKNTGLVKSKNCLRNPDYDDWVVTVPNTESRKVPESVIS